MDLTTDADSTESHVGANSAFVGGKQAFAEAAFFVIRHLEYSRADDQTLPDDQTAWVHAGYPQVFAKSRIA